jgi:glyoxylate utilization-related uncharacterized protein
MPKVSKDTAQFGDHGPVREHSQDIDGYTVNFVEFLQDIDATPLMKGLPDDRCHSPHWGYMVKGRITYRFADHEEVIEAGDAFYLPPGHIPVSHEPGTQIVQFSPVKELHEVSEAIMRNMQAMQAGAGAAG